MKYITAKMWRGWQSRSDTVATRATKAAEINSALYRKSLKTVAGRLGAKPARFFTHHSLHDGHLLSFNISDLAEEDRKLTRAPHVTSLQITVLSGTKTAVIYLLLYRGIQEISVRTKNNLFALNESRFGDWGYDELLPEGKNLLRHNILFQTGTEVSVVFEKFDFRRKMATKQALQQYARNQID